MNKKISEEIQATIKNLLRHYTREEIAAFVGVSGNTIFRWEKGIHKPHRSFEKTLKGMSLKGGEK